MPVIQPVIQNLELDGNSPKTQQIENKFNNVLKEYYDYNRSDKTTENEKWENELKELNTKVIDLYYEAGGLIKSSHDDVRQTNDTFGDTINDINDKKRNYDNHKDKSSASHKFKLDVYDRNIEDNIFIIYYLLSYGILGLFIYKLLKQ